MGKTVWTPTLENSGKLLGDALQEMLVHYKDKLDPLPFSMRLVENPASPIHLPGAVSLIRHDLIHILIGCNTTLTGEAFIVGFTMGAALRLRPWHLRFYEWFVMHVFPENYRLTTDQWTVFHDGVRLARKMGIRDLHKLPLEKMLQRSIGSLREEIGLHPHLLQTYYATHDSLS